MSVRSNSIVTFSVLSPREPLLPIPYAIYAGAAGIASSVSNSAVTASTLNTVAAPASGQVLSYTGSGLSWITPTPSGGLTLPCSGSASSSSSIFTLQNTGTGPAGAFLGNVGIGTTAPTAGLDAVTISNNAVAVCGTNSYSGVYGQLAVSDSHNYDSQTPGNAYIGVYGNDGLTTPVIYDGRYAGIFEGNVVVNGGVYVFGNVGVYGILSVSSLSLSSPLQFPGAGADTSTPVFTHQTTVANVIGNKTYINNPVCNGQPNAILIITENWHASNNVGNSKVVGVYYDAGVGEWTIFVDDGTAMPVGVAYNVMVTLP